jgi:hypothetical protein
VGKSWSGDEFEFIAQTLRKHDLVPENSQPAILADHAERYVLYDFDQDELVGSRVYDDPKTAADDASELSNVIVVPFVLPRRATMKSIDQPEPCECQQPGDFCSGVPGILARVENCRVVTGGKVERCDLCQRYPSDQAAHDKLVELGMA